MVLGVWRPVILHIREPAPDHPPSRFRPPHRISLRLAARLLRLPLQGGVIPALQTGNILYTLDREQGSHLAKGSGKEPFAGLKITPPWRGSRRDQGSARRRAGGGEGNQRDRQADDRDQGAARGRAGGGGDAPVSEACPGARLIGGHVDLQGELAVGVSLVLAQGRRIGAHLDPVSGG